MKTEEIRLSDLLARTVEEGDYLLWTGHSNGGKFPQWRIGGKLLAARRVIWSLTHEAEPNGVWIGCKCGTGLCVHPDHLVARNRSKAMRGAMKPDHKVRVTIGRRANSRLDMDKVRTIRASDEPGPVIEARYGLKPGYASRIRTNRCWVDTASPFAGLGAR